MAAVVAPVDGTERPLSEALVEKLCSPLETQVSSAVRNLSAYGGGWLWGGASAEYTGNVNVTRAWTPAFAITAPTLPAGPMTLWDMSVNGNFGNVYHYGRGARMRTTLGWRLLVNGTVVGTRATTGVVQHDLRAMSGNSAPPSLRTERVTGGSFHWSRVSVPSGASIQVDFQATMSVSAAQSNTSCRFYAGAYREAAFSFAPRSTVLSVEDAR